MRKSNTSATIYYSSGTTSSRRDGRLFSKWVSTFWKPTKRSFYNLGSKIFWIRSRNSQNWYWAEIAYK